MRGAAHPPQGRAAGPLRAGHGIAFAGILAVGFYLRWHQLLDQIQACSTRGHRIDIKVGPGFARRQGQILTWYNPAAAPASTG